MRYLYANSAWGDIFRTQGRRFQGMDFQLNNLPGLSTLTFRAQGAGVLLLLLHLLLLFFGYPPASARASTSSPRCRLRACHKSEWSRDQRRAEPLLPPGSFYCKEAYRSSLLRPALRPLFMKMTTLRPLCSNLF